MRVRPQEHVRDLPAIRVEEVMASRPRAGPQRETDPPPKTGFSFFFPFGFSLKVSLEVSILEKNEVGFPQNMFSRQTYILRKRAPSPKLIQSKNMEGYPEEDHQKGHMLEATNQMQMNCPNLSIWLCLCLSICPPIDIDLSIYPSTCSSMQRVSICISICPFVAEMELAPSSKTERML